MLLLVLACVCASPKDQFSDEYLVEVGNLKREFAEARGVAIIRAVKDGNKLGNPTTYQFATGTGRRKVEFDGITQLYSGTSTVSRYGYAELDGRNIEVQRTGPSDPYKVRAIGDDDVLRRSLFDAVFGKYLNAPWGFVGYDIGNAYSKGWFSIIEAREVEEHGKSLVEVTFRLTTMKEPNYYQATFDPTLHWAIMRASSWKADPTKPSERFEATYGPTTSGRIYTKSVRWWGLDGEEVLCEFGPVDFTPTPTSEFTLEHYTLKSPPLPTKKPNYLIVAAIASLAVVLLVAAWFTRWLATRRS